MYEDHGSTHGLNNLHSIDTITIFDKNFAISNSVGENKKR